MVLLIFGHKANIASMSFTRPFSGRKNEKANSEFNQQNGLFGKLYSYDAEMASINNYSFFANQCT